MSSVAIIMSSYNGRDYIKDQVDSLLAQTLDNIQVFIRDDGSTDGSRQLIEQTYRDKPQVTLLPDEGINLGFGASFAKAMKHALSDSHHYDYFAFCDQDDYWLPEKIETAIRALDALDKNKPLLFSSNYYICDQNLQGDVSLDKDNPMAHVTFDNLAFEGVFPGFTLVINRKLAELAFETNPSDIYYHDKWVSLIALGLGGQIIYEKRPLARYRRHGSAASSTDLGLLAKLRWRIDKVLKGDFCLRTQNMLKSYKDLFYSDSSPEIKHFLDVFTGDNRFSKLFFPKRLRRSLTGELMLRFIILLGKL